MEIGYPQKNEDLQPCDSLSDAHIILRHVNIPILAELGEKRLSSVLEE